MVCHIETSRNPDGCWIAKVLTLPGMQIYGYSQEETLVAARKLTAMLLGEGDGWERRDERILVFYPGRVPDSARSAA